MAKRTKRRNSRGGSRKRVSKKNNRAKRVRGGGKGKRTIRGKGTRRIMGGGQKWTCGKCGVPTNQNPCATVVGHEEYIGTLYNGNRERRERNVYCGAVKPVPAPAPAPDLDAFFAPDPSR
jgi:hypothetical protein